jgi:hypothetical protein
MFLHYFKQVLFVPIIQMQMEPTLIARLQSNWRVQSKPQYCLAKPRMSKQLVYSGHETQTITQLNLSSPCLIRCDRRRQLNTCVTIIALLRMQWTMTCRCIVRILGMQKVLNSWCVEECIFRLKWQCKKPLKVSSPTVYVLLLSLLLYNYLCWFSCLDDLLSKLQTYTTFIVGSVRVHKIPLAELCTRFILYNKGQNLENRRYY